MISAIRWVSELLGVAGVTASVASIVLSGGGSSLISLIGIVRATSEIIQQCKSLYDDAGRKQFEKMWPSPNASVPIRSMRPPLCATSRGR